MKRFLKTWLMIIVFLLVAGGGVASVLAMLIFLSKLAWWAGVIFAVLILTGLEAYLETLDYEEG